MSSWPKSLRNKEDSSRGTPRMTDGGIMVERYEIQDGVFPEEGRKMI